jgi:putative PIN family toxin of toxin-antitoxin system
VRVFLDTNVLVSAVATRGLCAEVLHIVLAEHDLIVGERVLGELRKALRQKIGLVARAIEEVEAFLRRQGHVVRSKQPPSLAVRDAADSLVLAEAIEAGVDVVVTGGNDVLRVAGQAPFPIVTPRGFWNLLRVERRD